MITEKPKLKLNTNPNRCRLAPTCPCGKSNKDGKFTPYEGYIDKGYCHSCSELFTPNTGTPEFKTTPFVAVPQTEFISPEKMIETFGHYEINNFVRFLVARFGVEATKELIKRYNLGTARNGSVIFWQVDDSNNIRTGHIMQYDSVSGKRCKEPYSNSWVHKKLGIENYRQCLFGLHLTKGNNKPCGIVESEKSAVLMSVFAPQFIWLASSGATSLSANKCRTLIDRKVILFPDLNKFELWERVASEMESFCDVSVNNILERIATPQERENGLDIADYYLRESEPSKPTEIPSEQISISHDAVHITSTSVSPCNYSDLDQLERELKAVESNAAQFQISKHETVTDFSHFVESHLMLAKIERNKGRIDPHTPKLLALLALTKQN